MQNPPKLHRLLVVEDDSLVRHALIRQLDKAFAVEAVSGPDAARVALAVTQFDLILTDYAMPERSGVAFAKELRASGFVGPVILLTAVPTATDIPEALQSGVIQAIVQKPWNRKDLIALLSARVTQTAR